jgi:hypothetical protein
LATVRVRYLVVCECLYSLGHCGVCTFAPFPTPHMLGRSDSSLIFSSNGIGARAWRAVFCFSYITAATPSDSRLFFFMPTSTSALFLLPVFISLSLCFQSLTSISRHSLSAIFERDIEPLSSPLSTILFTLSSPHGYTHHLSSRNQLLTPPISTQPTVI